MTVESEHTKLKKEKKRKENFRCRWELIAPADTPDSYICKIINTHMFRDHFIYINLLI